MRGPYRVCGVYSAGMRRVFGRYAAGMRQVCGKYPPLVLTTSPPCSAAPALASHTKKNVPRPALIRELRREDELTQCAPWPAWQSG